MEKFVQKLEVLFQKKISLYKTLKNIFEQERKHIVDMDVDSLWKITDRKKQISSEILQIREQIFSLFEEKKLPMDKGEKGFSLFQSINRLPFSAKIKSNLKKLKSQLDIGKEELIVLALENKRYINEYLSVINDIFVTITGTENSELYTNVGTASKEKNKKHLIRAQV
ncbi:MAG: flagellar protein FlgN [Desulfobacteraceae bacterium]|nr:flagellar protein FlgN [Desulfobacteraceae bacterium]